MPAFNITKEGSYPISWRPLPGKQRFKSVVLTLDSNAGYFLWIDLSPYLPPATTENGGPRMQERILAQRFMDAGIYLATGEKFASEDAGWFRVIFTHEKAKLAEGLRR